MAESSTSVAAYHRQLSSHLSDLLRSTGSTKPLPSPLTRLPKKPHTTSSISMSKMSSAESSHSHTTNDTTSPQPLRPSSDTSRPPPLVGTSSRTQSTETTAPVATPPVSPHQAAMDARADQMRVWKEAGSSIFTPLRSDFNLVLNRPPKEGKGVSTGVTKKGVKGLGIDLHISRSQDLAIRMGLMCDDSLVSRPIPRHAQLDPTRLSAKPSMESLSAKTNTTGPSPAIAPSLIITGPSHPVPLAGPSGVSSASGVQRRRKGEESSQAKRQQVGQMSLRDPREDEKMEDYEARRELRLKKKQAELAGKIVTWRESVQLVSLEVSFTLALFRLGLLTLLGT